MTVPEHAKPCHPTEHARPRPIRQMFRARLKDTSRLQQKLAGAAVSLAEAAPTEASGSEEEPPLAVPLVRAG